MSIDGVLGNQAYAETISNARRENAAAKRKELQEAGFLKTFEDKKCPYSSMAKGGIIEYNGVVFNCDYKRNAITLGDVESDPKKVLNISLPSGGSLKVNVDNLGDLSRAAGMFTPEDLNAILNAIHEYNHCTSKLNEIEDEENTSPEDAAEEMEDVNETQSPIEALREYKNKIYDKLMNGDTEQKFMIGNQEFSIKEWDKLISDFDEVQEDLREAVREELEARQEKQDKREALANTDALEKLFDPDFY